MIQVKYHKELAAGRWFELSLVEQMANIGSEVHRTLLEQQKAPGIIGLAAERCLELFDLTLADVRWRHRLKEIARAREFFCGALFGVAWYKTSLEDLDRYFLQFAYAARQPKK